MPYFGLHYGGTYSVNPLGIRRDSEAPSRGWMDRKTTSAAGLASSRGTPIAPRSGIRHGGARHGAGTGRLGDRFRPGRLDQSRIRECRQHVLVRRALWPGLGAPFAGLQSTLGVPPRPSVRISMRSSGTSKASWADNRVRSRTFSPRRPPRRSRRQSRCHEPGRSWPIFSHRGAIRRRLRLITAPCSRSSPIWCRCASRWRR